MHYFLKPLSKKEQLMIVILIIIFVIAVVVTIRYSESVLNDLLDNTEEKNITENIDEPVKATGEVQIVKENRNYYVQDGAYKYELNTEYQDYLYEMCVKYDIKQYYTLLLAQMYHESRFNLNAISETEDYGLMQINKCNHEWLEKKLGNGNFLNPYTNIEAGVYMMSDFIHKYNDVHKALVCYNRGENAMNSGIYVTDYSNCVINDMNKLIVIENRKEN